MKDLLDKAGLTIQDMTDTSIERIGNAISAGLAKGDSYEATANTIEGVTADRADMIANTEYSRAMTTASEQTYKESGIEEEEFEAEADACEECIENQDAGPISVDDEFPNGPVPVHPRCRCAQKPVVKLGEPEADEPSSE